MLKEGSLHQPPCVPWPSAPAQTPNLHFSQIPSVRSPASEGRPGKARTGRQNSAPPRVLCLENRAVLNSHMQRTETVPAVAVSYAPFQQQNTMNL